MEGYTYGIWQGMGGMGGMGGGADVLGAVEKSGRAYKGRACWVGAEGRERVRGLVCGSAQEGQKLGEGGLANVKGTGH